MPIYDDPDDEPRRPWQVYELPNTELARLQYENGRLRDAMATQAEIGHAIGILMATSGMDSAAVSELLQQIAQSAQLRLTDLARALIEIITGAETTNQRAADIAREQLLGPGTEAPVPPPIDLRSPTRLRRS